MTFYATLKTKTASFEILEAFLTTLQRFFLFIYSIDINFRWVTEEFIKYVYFLDIFYNKKVLKGNQKKTS